MMNLRTDGHRHVVRAASALLAAVVIVAGCSDSSKTTTSASGSAASGRIGSSSTPGGGGAAAFAVTVATVGTLGPVLVNGQGRTLYVLSSEQGGTITCTDDNGCTKVWPDTELPAGTTKGIAGDGASAALLGTAKSARGDLYLTYGGYPLYTFTGDTGSGQANGEGIMSFGGTWTVMSAAGLPVGPLGATTAPSPTSGSAVLPTTGAPANGPAASPTSAPSDTSPAASTTEPATTAPPTTSAPTTTAPSTTAPTTTSPPPTTSCLYPPCY